MASTSRARPRTTAAGRNDNALGGQLSPPNPQPPPTPPALKPCQPSSVRARPPSPSASRVGPASPLAVPKDELLGISVYGCQPGPIDFDQLHPKIQAVAAGSYREKQPPEIEGSGYSPPALEAALWALYTTSSWEEGALAAVNLGDNADTTAAIYGQLAGAIYGVEAIPERWLELLVMREEIEAVAGGLWGMAGTGWR